MYMHVSLVTYGRMVFTVVLVCSYHSEAAAALNKTVSALALDVNDSTD